MTGTRGDDEELWQMLRFLPDFFFENPERHHKEDLLSNFQKKTKWLEIP